MATSTECPPHPGSLLESLRNLGYSLGAAIADLIDNSITASASKIEIYHDFDQVPPRIAIVDDGKGMAHDELFIAMRMGSSSPLDCRSANDLGRFGLGLKTASFSQARRFTVVTRKDGVWAGARWDLDQLDERWKLDLLDEEEIASVSWVDSIHGDGTMVLLEKLDRLGEATKKNYSQGTSEGDGICKGSFGSRFSQVSCREIRVPHFDSDQ